jgi:triphosphatase
MNGGTIQKEVEVKLELPPASLRALKKVPLFKTPSKQTREVSVYFDTDKHKLRKNGLMLRVRRVGNRYVQTIKATGNSGPFERDEWEAELPGQEPDLRMAEGTALERLANDKLRRQLKPLFETRVHRSVYPVVDDRRAIALTVDRGSIDTGNYSMPLCEIELELQRGKLADLFDGARELTRTLSARIAFKSKSQRGYELIDGTHYAPVKGKAIDLPLDAITRDAFKIVGIACLGQIIGNEAAVLQNDPEGVHQMRVGLRRLRAGMSLFSDLVRDPQTAAIKSELKWLGAELGPARELEVLVNRVIAPIKKQRVPWEGVPSLGQQITKKRKAAVTRAKMRSIRRAFVRSRSNLRHGCRPGSGRRRRTISSATAVTS